ncbi:MAG: hypothetical protein ACE5GY_07775 [Thermodesulfobacteriota bacterium]
MSLYEEKSAVEHIRSLPMEARLHLSHVVRNGLCGVLSAVKLGADVERAIYEFESRWRELE